jgi:acetyl esterase/lipase
MAASKWPRHKSGEVIMKSLWMGVPILAGAAAVAPPQQPANSAQEPRALVYREVDGRSLQAYVFSPKGQGTRRPAPAILLFHGGGWAAGSADWTFDAARRFASLGMVAISIDYRLSQGEVTPIEALSDTCSALLWTRSHADELNIDPRRVAGYGVSAGGHLIAAAATIGCPSRDAGQSLARPDLLLLWSPALDVAGDGWYVKLLQGRASPAQYSPAEHAGAATPPTSIVHGASDTLTPLSGARRFCDRTIRAGGICELNVYQGLGHLLTRNLKNQESDFDPDPAARADGIAQHEKFLRTRGFLPGK